MTESLFGNLFFGGIEAGGTKLQIALSLDCIAFHRNSRPTEFSSPTEGTLPPTHCVSDLPELASTVPLFPSLIQALSKVSAPSLPSSLSQKEQEKSEKVSKRVSAVEEVRSHVKVLQEMLSVYRRPGQAPPDQEALQVKSKFKYNGV